MECVRRTAVVIVSLDRQCFVQFFTQNFLRVLQVDKHICTCVIGHIQISSNNYNNLISLRKMLMKPSKSTFQKCSMVMILPNLRGDSTSSSEDIVKLELVNSDDTFRLSSKVSCEYKTEQTTMYRSSYFCLNFKDRNSVFY